MSAKSAIEWTDATWNPVTGCTKVSAGCKHCYAETWAKRHFGEFSKDHGRQFGDVRVHAEKLEIPKQWTKPRRIFVNSMSDLFHEDVPMEFINRVWDTMAACPQHTFQILTKRPERMILFLGGESGAGLAAPALPNVWLGVSVEDQKAAMERIPLLMYSPAAVRFLSCEPLLGPVDLDAVRESPANRAAVFSHETDGPTKMLHWVICGGESGPHARPMHPNWARSLRDQCLDQSLPFFFKQWGEWAPVPAISGIEKIGVHTPSQHVGCGTTMFRVGKKAAGASIDGREWKEFPETKRQDAASTLG